MEDPAPARGTLATVASNFRITLAARVCLKVLQFAIAVWVVRRLGREDYGRYSLLTAYYLFFQVASDLGTGFMVMQRAGEPDAEFRSLFQRVFRLRMYLVTASAALCLPVTVALGYEPELAGWMVAFALPNILLANMNQFYTVWFQSQQTMPIVVGGEIAGQLSALVFMCLALAANGSYAALFAALVCGEVVRACYYYRRIPFAPLRDREPPHAEATSGALLSASWPLAVMVILQILLVRVDTVMLSRLHSLAAVGFYGAAQRLCQIMTMAAEAFMPLVVPVLVRHVRTEPQKGILFFRLSFKYLALYAAPMAVCLWMYASPLVTMLFKKSFEPAAQTLAINAWATLAGLLYTISNYLMIALGRERQNLVFLGSSVLFNVLANFWVLPRFGQDGAAVTSILSYMLHVFLCLTSSTARPFVAPALAALVAPIAIAWAAAIVPVYLGLGPVAGLAVYAVLFLPLASLLFLGAEDRAVLSSLAQWRTRNTAA